MKRRLVTENQLLSKPSSSSRCWKSTQMWKRRLWSWGFSACKSCNRYPLTRRRLSRMPQTLDWGICNSRLGRCVDFWWLLTNVSSTLSTVSADGPGRHRQPLCWNVMYHSRNVLSVRGSVWYMVRKLRCTVTIDSVLANFKTQNAFVFLVHAMFRHDCPLAVKPANTPRRLVLKKKTWRDSLPIDMLLPAVSVLVVAQPSSEIPEGLMNYPVQLHLRRKQTNKNRVF